MPGFAGIDLTSSERKASAYALLTSGMTPALRTSLYTDAAILDAVDEDQPSIVAIDAPLTLPAGLCCLNEECGCAPVSLSRGRACERELARMGIPCYFTTKKCIIRPMVYRAAIIRDSLLARGHRVIEVYPYASKVRLWGRPPYRKATAKGLEYLHQRLAALIPGLANIAVRLDHDRCDALIAAYTAYLEHGGKTDIVGDPDEGTLSIPHSSVAV
ncbi:MAG: DUF429 domain-containing protein [Dehalococcoidia bacterium]|nr:DUF429 domain-containing protein [Dehalococcoidia bacterium]